MADEKLDITTALREYTALVSCQLDPVNPNGATHPCVVTPPGYTVQSLHGLIYNEYAARPHRIKQTVTVLDPKSFIDYWAAFANPASRIFGDRDNKRFLAILDYHQPATESSEEYPQWGSHTLTLQLKHTEEWTTWISKNETELQQSAMALFLEDNAPDVIEPSAARMIEIASSLDATTDVKFESSVVLQNSSRKFKYFEETKAKAGELEIPKEFTIAIPVFEGMARVEIKARFRYKIPSGKLTLSYSLWRHAAAEREAFEAVRSIISDQCGQVLLGKP